MRSKWFVVVLFVLTCVGAMAAQGTQTGILRGTVTTTDKVVLPGATVTLRSPALQAERTAVTGPDGAFLFRGIPPGSYTVTFTKDAMQALERKIDVPLGGAAELNVAMAVATRAEAVTVTGDVSNVLTTPTVGANITKKTVDALALPRGLVNIASLSPGVTMNSPNSNQLVINGGFAYDNVFLINGIDISDNIFGSPQRLFIEDAIQETQVLTSGIPAEYGRFGGGVVNAITKSGGNVFSGSFRVNLGNPTWSTLTPFDVTSGVTHESKLNTNYEATIGGPIVKDKLWFFGATRVANTETPTTFPTTGVSYNDINNNKRAELKLTASPRTNHTLQLSYINNATSLTAPPFDFSIEPHTIFEGSEPNSIIGVSWRGVLGGKYFAEAGYSQRKLSFLGEGGIRTDVVDSPFIGLSQLVHYNAPYFDATDPQDRNNRQLTGTVSYSVVKGGRHDFKAGYEWFRSHLRGGNSQSATNFVFDADFATDAFGMPLLDASGFLIPLFIPGETLIEHWFPVRGAVNNTDTHSLFIQDHWAVNRNVSFDLGLRFEKVRSEATGGILGVDTSTIVPRLAMAYDPMGNGRTVFHATYGHYAGKYNESLIGGNNNVGNPDLLLGVYDGPPGTGRNFAPGFDPNNYFTVFGRFPTANVTVAEGMSSPVTKEFTLSMGTGIGTKGDVQFTYVWRNTTNFIDDYIDISNGTTNVVKSGVDLGTFTNIVIDNADDDKRGYQGLVFQGRYTLRSNWTVAGNWTVQLKNDGTFEGEGTNQPGVLSFVNDYEGIYDLARHFPNGHLQSYQQSKIRLWSTYTASLGRWGTVGVSGLVRYESPRVYSLVATGVPLSAIQQDILATLGYPDAPGDQDIFFGERGSERFHSYTLFDTSINYDIAVFKKASPFVKVDIFNLFDSRKMIGFDTTISADPNSPLDALGLPTGYIKGPNFGTATSANHFPQPFQGQTGGRTFRISVGFRF